MRKTLAQDFTTCSTHSARFLYRYNLKLCLSLDFKLTPASKLNIGSDSCFLHLTLLPERMPITDSMSPATLPTYIVKFREDFTLTTL